MSIDRLSKSQNTQSGHHSQNAPARRRWKRILLVVGMLVVSVSAVVLMPSAISPRESGPTLTHTIKRGDLVLLEAFGGGFTWGSALLKF